ncbi:CLUMA_CG017482, isoform A [Clunio marinus]|uniref:type I protein arginine methyltransferase n=1 Tax=Clunio marinus TaxID=568069 RepID=A0A1J1IXV1_9DIPT|nr:CLUMA_CG017482, isoform A [Clunio marinus]
MEVDTNDEYFTSYENLEIHEIMLTDTARNEAYRKAITTNSSLFNGKVVLDVGSGTGILSIFAAQAGASQVFAVEASNLAKLSQEIIKENNFENVIKVFNCRIEDFQLPESVDKVDIIISEWMGFYLLHEGMLDSVLLARDRFLKPGGLLFPDRAILYCSPCNLPTHFDNWDNVSGVKMSKYAECLRKQKSSKPEIINIDKDCLIADDIVIAFLDLSDISTTELNRIDFNEVIIARKSGKFQGLCIWFDVLFPCGDDNEEEVILSTHPQAQSTHWKQTIIPLPSNIETFEPLDPIAFKLIVQRNPENSRHYHLLLEILDAMSDDVQHPLPCECHMTKCILTKAHLANMTDSNGFENA